MRRVVLLAILALALPMAALANTITYTTGPFVNGICEVKRHCSAPSPVNIIGVSITGSLNQSGLTARWFKLSGSADHRLGTCYDISAGLVHVSHARTLLFQNFFSGIANKHGKSGAIMGSLAPPPTLPFRIGSITVNFTLLNTRATTLVDGTATVSVTILPEPDLIGICLEPA